MSGKKMSKKSPKKNSAQKQAMVAGGSSGSGIPKGVTAKQMRENRDLYLMPTMRVA